MKTLITLFILVILLSSCGAKQNSIINPVSDWFKSNIWVNSFTKVLLGYPDYPITREMVEGIPYASLRIKIGKGPAGLMILQEIKDDNYSYVSQDSVLIKIKKGRIIRTSRLNNNLVDYYYDNDPEFKKLIKGSISHKQTSSDISFLEIIKGNVSFYELITFEKERFFYSTRVISLDNPIVKGLAVQVYTKLESEEESIQILDREYKVILIKEVVENKRIKWKHENLYWVDPKTGFVWKSIQQIAPNVPAISLEITKAPSI